MKLFFYYDPNNDKFKTFKTEKDRDVNLLQLIDDLYVNEEKIYDDDLIKDIQIGVITHHLKYKPVEIKTAKEEWMYSPYGESAGEYEIKQIKSKTL